MDCLPIYNAGLLAKVIALINPAIFSKEIVQLDDLPVEVGDADAADDDGVVSETSTVEHEHEPFETIQDKIRIIAAKHFGRAASDIQIERMKGGTYNRVVGISVTSKLTKFSLEWIKWHIRQILRCMRGLSLEERKDSYVMRIPREIGHDTTDQELAILKVVAECLPLPVPEVVAYDIGSENLLVSPYMFQKRLPGLNLQRLWETLNMAQKKSVTEQIMNLASVIASVEGPAGEIAAENLARTPGSSVLVEKFCVPGRCIPPSFFNKPVTWTAASQKPLDQLIEQCERWREYQTAEGFCFHETWDSYVAIAKSLDTRGFLHGSSVLLHGDLMPYNLLAEIRSPTQVEITGVIDWDTAKFGPEFLAYPAPYWLWTWDEIKNNEYDHEKNALFEPRDGGEKELKAFFMKHASDKYKHFAFAPEAMLARRLFPILQNGMFDSCTMSESSNIIREWDELHPEDGVIKAESASDSESGDYSER